MLRHQSDLFRSDGSTSRVGCHPSVVMLLCIIFDRWCSYFNDNLEGAPSLGFFESSFLAVVAVAVAVAIVAVVELRSLCCFVSFRFVSFLSWLQSVLKHICYLISYTIVLQF